MNVSECNPRIACRMREDGHWEAVHSMPDHLPECLPHIRLTVFTDGLRETCQTCAALRACEARVLDENVTRWREELRQSNAYERAAALDAARDAVADVRAQAPQPFGEFIYREVLPAIDALRGSGYSDSHQPQIDGTEAHDE